MVIDNRESICQSGIFLNVVISLLEDLKCKNTATQDSYSDYARFLKDLAWIKVIILYFNPSEN